MKTKLIYIPLLLTLLKGMWAFANERDISSELVEEALKSNQGLQEIVSQINSLTYKSKAAERWEDPVFSVEYMNFPWNTFGFDEMGMTGVQIMLMQKFPFPGKNARRTIAERANIETKKWELEESKLKLAALIKINYYKLTLSRLLKKALEKHIELINSLIEAVSAKYESGASNQQDILRLQVLKNKLEDDIFDYERQEVEFAALINGALNRNAQMEIETPQDIYPPEPKVKFETFFLELVKHSPRIKMYEYKANAARLAAERAEYERWPDITLSLGYKIRAKTAKNDGVDYLSIGVSIPLPFDYTNYAETKRLETLEMASSAEQGRRNAIEMFGAELKKTLSAWSRYFQKAKNYEQKLYPAAQETLEAILFSYRTNRADFSSLYQAELELIEFEMEILKVKALAAIMKVHIETTIGKSIEKLANSKEEGKEIFDGN